MDLLIKSFNRPYYLDRCLFSIQKFVLNPENKITILDDGTPQKYLDKILSKYPNVTIIKSAYYDEKSKDIEKNQAVKNKNIPIDLWLNAAKTATDYFLLLEDDIWFTSEIDLNELQQTFEKDNIQLMKLFWLGNQNLISDKILKERELYKIYQPKLYIKNLFLYRFLFQFYKYKTRKLSTFFQFYTLERELNYYAIYSVAGAVFKKDYFLALWKNHTNIVDERLQLRNALAFFNKNRKSNFGNTNKEIVKTGFLSAATNEHKEYQNVSISMFEFNKIINEAWLNNKFETTDNLESDLDESQIELILDQCNDSKAQKKEWNKWVSHFRKQYETIGCVID